ncbi:MAG: hypothetical protein WBD95_24235 [Xanthobacteraceae bacterium]
MSRKLLLAPDTPVRDNNIGALLNESGRDSAAQERGAAVSENATRNGKRLRWRRLLTGLRTQANSNRRSA